MNIILPPQWRIPEGQVTEEKLFVSRRDWLKAAGWGLVGAALTPKDVFAANSGLPAKKSAIYVEGERKLTSYDHITSYNNFYEYSLKKERPKQLAQQLVTAPWKIAIGGEVEKPFEIEAEDLVKKMSLEQRVYRFRCVEAWSMVVPWDGFALKDLVKLAKPTSKAKYVEFKTFFDPSMAPNQEDKGYPWPYTEGLTIEEAVNDLSFMATGLYGKPLPKQNGAPLRLVVPWKYGFKSIKSIRSIRFTSEEPQTLWNQLAPREYGFYANVNPAVDHPRWSQKSEKVVGSWFERRDTLPFNGYAEQVASLYKGMDLRKFY